MADNQTEDLIIATGDVRNHTQNGAGGISAALYFGAVNYGHQPSLINHGTMVLRDDTTSVQTLIRFDTTSRWDRAEIRNSGVISAILPLVQSVTLFSSNASAPSLYNSGQLVVQASQQAMVLQSWGNGQIVVNSITGSIRATSEQSVLAVYMANGGTVTNAGEIVATSTGTAASSVFAISLPNGHAAIVNSGLIQASDNWTQSAAVAIGFYGSDTNTVVNTGTIRGDIAIRESNPYGYNSRATIDNFGLIDGLVSLAQGNDIVRNSGRIQGDVDLGADADIYDGRQGTIVGTVFGGAGNDLLIGGAGSDRLNGGDGDDALYGGGGDTLTGGAGADLFIFGASATGAVETITDFETGRDRIDLRGLAPSAVTIAGNSVTAVGATGTLTIRVTGALATSDILLPGAAASAATPGEDMLVAGDGGAVLTGGDSPDVLVGGSGNDRLDGGRGDSTGVYGDLMVGGAGDDLYIVNDARDMIIEYANAGIDTIQIVDPSFGSFPFELPDNVEHAIGGSAWGNALANTLTGSASGDGLRGFGGADVINGLGGPDFIDGGAGDDVLTGGAGSDILVGGAGADTFRDTLANFHGDTFHDFSAADRILIPDVTLAGFFFSVRGNILDFGGSIATFDSFPNGHFVASAAPEGGVQITVAIDQRAPNDYNGDRRGDIIWRHSNGEFAQWLGQSDGAFVHSGKEANPVDASWRIVGSGDYNGDGQSDLLWRHTSGALGQWLGQANGSFINNGAAARSIDTSWTIVGSGDFNGDGRADIIWRHSGGEFAQWLGQANGSFVHSGQQANPVDLSWRIVGSDDFNGDGIDDVLWRHANGELAEWLGQANGTFANNGSAAVAIDPAWRLIGTGDFNGDGRHDLVLRTTGGDVAQYLGQSNGGFVNNLVASSWMSPSWQLAAIGDYDGDGRDDLIWRNADGGLTEWLGHDSATFVPNDAATTQIAPGWQIQSPDLFLV